jgi:hypothetical protein
MWNNIGDKLNSFLTRVGLKDPKSPVPLHKFKNEDIIWFDPEAKKRWEAQQEKMKSQMAPSPTPIPKNNPVGQVLAAEDKYKNSNPSTLTPIPDPYEARTMETFDKSGIPREIAYGIRQAEDGVKNSYNIGATDANPTGALDYGSPEAEATAAAKLLNGTFEKDFIGSGRFNETFKPAFQQFQKDKNVEKFLKAIYEAGYAGDPNTWKQRSIDTGGAGQYFNNWDEFVKNTLPYQKWHKKY